MADAVLAGDRRDAVAALTADATGVEAWLVLDALAEVR
jgi:hypothetical protein